MADLKEVLLQTTLSLLYFRITNKRSKDPTVFAFQSCDIVPQQLRTALHGITLHGGTGCGKTYLLSTLAQWIRQTSTSDISMHWISCSDYVAGGSDSIKVLDELIYTTRDFPDKCVVLLIDDIDLIAKSIAASQFVQAITYLVDQSPQVVAISTALHAKQIPSRLKRAALFDRPIQIEYPLRWQRKLASRRFLESQQGANPVDQVAEMIASATPAFGCGDMLRLFHVLRSEMMHSKRHDYQGLLQTALDKVQPFSLREVYASSRSFMVQAASDQSSDSWESLYGYALVKDRIEHVVRWPFEYEDTYKRLGVSPSSGLLLIGPPGCGKTSFARGLGSRLKNAHFVEVLAPLLLSQYLGDSEARVRSLFRALQKLQPVVLFIDEIDVLAPGLTSSVGDSQSPDNVEKRIVTAFLTELDGINQGGGHESGNNQNRVFLVCCARSETSVHPALVRAGRIDTVIRVDLPSLQDRAIIISNLLRKYIDMHSPGSMLSQVEDIALSAAKCTEGFSGAALDESVRKSLQSCASVEELGQRLVTRFGIPS